MCCRKPSESLSASPPEAGTDQTSLPSPYSTLFPSEIKRPTPTLSVASLVSGTPLSTCGTSMGHSPVARTTAVTNPPAASHGSDLLREAALTGGGVTVRTLCTGATNRYPPLQG